MALVYVGSPFGGTRYEGISADGQPTIPVSSSVFRTGESYSWRANPIGTATAFIELGRGTDYTGYSFVNSTNATYRAYINIATLPASTSEEIASITNNDNFTITLKFALRINSSGNLLAFGSDGITQLGSTSSFSLSLNTWYRLEIQCGTGTAATWTVQVYDDNDVPTLMGSMTGTGNLNSAGVHGRVRWGKAIDRNGQTIDCYYTGIGIRDDVSSFCGHSRYKIAMAIGQGFYTAWNGTYLDVDEAPPHDGFTTVITANPDPAQSATETVTLQSASTIGLVATDTINAVRGVMAMAQNGAGSGFSHSTVLRWRIAGVDYDSVNDSPPSASIFTHMGQVRDVNPSTSSTWTQAGFNAIEIGPVQKSTTGGLACTAIWGYVDYRPGNPNLSGPPAIGGKIKIVKLENHFYPMYRSW